MAHPGRRPCDGEPSRAPRAKNTRERSKGSVWVHARAASLPAQASNTITYLYQNDAETTTLFVKWTTKLTVPVEVGRRLLRCYDDLRKE